MRLFALAALCAALALAALARRDPAPDAVALAAPADVRSGPIED